MSEHITHTAICDDCLRLARHSPEIVEPFQRAIDAQWEIARLGAVTRSMDRFSAPLLERLRDGWQSRSPGDNPESKLAYILGGLSHRAADRIMKPVFLAADPGSRLSPTECSVYHDVCCFREVFGSGRESPYSPAFFEERLASLKASQALSVADVEELFRVILQRALLELHTFIPDVEHVDAWLDRLFQRRQTFYVDLHRYAEAFTNPDPEKQRRFLVETNFYDREDAIIRCARRIQRGDVVDGAEILQSLAGAGEGSKYAQALGLGYGYIRAANRFWKREIGLEALKEALDIGKPGG